MLSLPLLPYLACLAAALTAIADRRLRDLAPVASTRRPDALGAAALGNPDRRPAAPARRGASADWLGTVKVRCGIGRDRYRIEPGLYRIGEPSPDSPVLVTGNYKLTVDVVRRDLAAENVWLLVVDTKGVNVWCAAGKKTFSSAEVARRVITSGLVDYVVPRDARAAAACGDRSGRSRGSEAVWLPRGVRTDSLGRHPGIPCRGNEGHRRDARGHLHFKERIELAPVEFFAALSGKRLLIPLALVRPGRSRSGDLVAGERGRPRATGARVLPHRHRRGRDRRARAVALPARPGARGEGRGTGRVLGVGRCRLHVPCRDASRQSRRSWAPALSPPTSA